mmetsp:Transcript_16433/g.40143  ORF Transcript_16433/g.40143 Transcript_16433/m.40143 type:complete len:247 (+) Transcript_16433:1611-2351(+)
MTAGRQLQTSFCDSHFHRPKTSTQSFHHPNPWKLVNICFSWSYQLVQQTLIASFDTFGRRYHWFRQRHRGSKCTPSCPPPKRMPRRIPSRSFLLACSAHDYLSHGVWQHPLPLAWTEPMTWIRPRLLPGLAQSCQDSVLRKNATGMCYDKSLFHLTAQATLQDRFEATAAAAKAESTNLGTTCQFRRTMTCKPMAWRKLIRLVEIGQCIPIFGLADIGPYSDDDREYRPVVPAWYPSILQSTRSVS